jgi:three-Cys-motif partner protein
VEERSSKREATGRPMTKLEIPDYVDDPADDMPARVVRPWTRRKHHYLGRYARMFSTGMSKRWGRRAYLDLFAGPGRCLEWESREFYDGSPLLAFHRPFTDHIYVELDPDAAEALERRCRPWWERFPWVIQGDCNDEIDHVLGLLPERGITFAFVDPTNWQIRFETIEHLTNNARVDLLVTFHAGAMKRVFELEEQPRLDAFFGTTAWRTDPRYWGPDLQPTLGGLLTCYRDQLIRIGYLDVPTAREITVVNSTNSPMYLMAFFSKHRLGYQFWDEVTGVDERGQLAIPWQRKPVPEKEDNQTRFPWG